MPLPSPLAREDALWKVLGGGGEQCEVADGVLGFVLEVALSSEDMKDGEIGGRKDRGGIVNRAPDYLHPDADGCIRVSRCIGIRCIRSIEYTSCLIRKCIYILGF